MHKFSLQIIFWTFKLYKAAKRYLHHYFKSSFACFCPINALITTWFIEYKLHGAPSSSCISVTSQLCDNIFGPQATSLNLTIKQHPIKNNLQVACYFCPGRREIPVTALLLHLCQRHTKKKHVNHDVMYMLILCFLIHSNCRFYRIRYLVRKSDIIQKSYKIWSATGMNYEAI